MNVDDTIQPVGSRLATIELWRMPDGAVHGRIRHMEPRLIDTTGQDVPDRLRIVAGWTMEAAAHLEDEAGRLDARQTKY